MQTLLLLFLLFTLPFGANLQSSTSRSITPTQITEEPTGEEYVVTHVYGTGPYKLIQKANTIFWDYYLQGPDGEVDLKTPAASLSPSEKFLAYSVMTGEVPEADNKNKVVIKNLTNTDIQKIYIAAPDDPAGNFAWSPDGKYLAFTSVGQDNDFYPKHAKWFVANLADHTFHSYDLELFFSCGSLCATDSLKWSPDSKQILGVYRNFKKDDSSNWTYQFVILDAMTGKVLHLVDYPDRDEDTVDYEFSADMKKIRYYFEPSKWIEVPIPE